MVLPKYNRAQQIEINEINVNRVPLNTPNVGYGFFNAYTLLVSEVHACKNTFAFKWVALDNFVYQDHLLNLKD